MPTCHSCHFNLNVYMTLADALPGLDDWRDWFDAMARLQAAAPWRHMDDHELFAVCDAGNPAQTAYCSVLGSAGVSYGMTVFMGAGGFHSFCSMITGTLLANDPLGATLDCIRLSYERHDDLLRMAPCVKDAAAALGLALDPAGTWPCVSRYRPCTVMQPPSGDDLRLAALCIDQAIDIAARKQRGDVALPRWQDSRILTRVCARTGTELCWADEVRSAPPPPPPVRPAPVPPPAGLLDAVRTNCRQTQATWQCDSRMFPLVTDDALGIHDLLVCVDHHSGYLYGTRIMEHMADFRNVPREFMQVLLHAGEYPGELVMRTSAVADVLQPSADALGIHIRKAEQLARCDAVYADLLAYMIKQSGTERRHARTGKRR